MLQMESSNALLVFFGFVSSVLGLITTIFWLVVGWRAMRAHEEIAASLRGDRAPQG